MFKSETGAALNEMVVLLTSIGDECSDKGGDSGPFGLRLCARVGPVGMMHLDAVSCLSPSRYDASYRVQHQKVKLT